MRMDVRFVDGSVKFSNTHAGSVRTPGIRGSRDHLLFYIGKSCFLSGNIQF